MSRNNFINVATTKKEVKNVRIIGIGIATMDFYCHQNKMYPGGNEYNIAYNAKLLNADVGFMGVFANDEVGKILERELTIIGVDTSHSHHEIGSSGYALVDLVDGDRVFLDWNKRGVTDLFPFTFTEEEIGYIKTFDIACISWGARVDSAKIAFLFRKGVPICYDFYDNFTNDDIEQIAPFIRFAFFSCSHLSETETKNVLKKAVSLGPEVAIGTRGKSATIAFNGSVFTKQASENVKAVDTMGAGDAYISAFLVDYLTNSPDESLSTEIRVQKALGKAAIYAAGVVMKTGSLGIGYDFDLERLSEFINLEKLEIEP